MEEQTWNDYLDQLDFANDQLRNARSAVAASNIEPLELGIARLQSALTIAKSGFSDQVEEGETSWTECSKKL